MGLCTMISRLWYPQLDVFDTARRMCILLYNFDTPPGYERLCIADFFFANPPLLHKATMTVDMRKSFYALGIKRPNKSFISYPDAPLLFHKMKPIRKGAMDALSGKGIVSLEQTKRGYFE